MPRSTRSAQLQIRVTPLEKARLKRLAHAAGQDVSSFVLSCVLPPHSERLVSLLDTLRGDADRRFTLAELNDALSDLSPRDFAAATELLDLRRLDPLTRNYVTAMIEQAAWLKHVPAPAWAREVPPLDEPWFATTLVSLRPHLLRASPVAFRRRNIFVDSSVGSRV